MIYSVKAVPISERMAEFYQKLTDGTIGEQKPDGQEILHSMKRAKISESGVVEWSEGCFCSTPLKHERETVYDEFFTDLQTEPISDYVDFDGNSFFEFLKNQAQSK